MNARKISLYDGRRVTVVRPPFATAATPPPAWTSITPAKGVTGNAGAYKAPCCAVDVLCAKGVESASGVGCMCAEVGVFVTTGACCMCADVKSLVGICGGGDVATVWSTEFVDGLGDSGGVGETCTFIE